MSDRGKKLKPKDLRQTNRGAEPTGRARVRSSRREVRRENKPITEERVRTTERRPARSNHEEDRRRGGGVPWWVWLLGLAAIGLVLFMVFAGGDAMDGDADSTGTTSEGTDSTGTGAGETDTRDADADGTATGGTATDGTLSAAGMNLLSASSSGGDLAQYEGESVEGRAVPVESVVSDEGFWVGNSTEERLFVFLDLEDESGPDVDAGDMVDLSGTVTATPDGFAESLGVTDEEGALQMEQQGNYIEATQIEEAA